MQAPRRTITAAATALAATLITAAAVAAAGAPDSDFGGTGIVTTDFGGSDVAYAVALQPDGRIVVGGGTSAGPTFGDFALARFNPDGTLDTTLGGGKLTTDIGGAPNGIFDLVVQPDGKIVVAGHSLGFNRFGFARYNPDGSLDDGFGAGGKVSLVAGRAAFSVARQPDGKIVAAGDSDGKFALARLDTDGSPDPSFDGDGRLVTDVGPYAGGAAAVALQPDGKIVAAGFATPDFALVRYNPDGSLDPAFGVGGKLTTDFGGFDSAVAVAVQPDGKIVAAGLRRPFAGGAAEVAIARYATDGSLDAAFGSGGKVTTDLPGDSDGLAGDIAVQPDGKLVVVGTVQSAGSDAGFLVARYDSAGNLDQSFGDGGIVITSAGNFATDVALDAEGRIVVAGSAAGDFAVARYDADDVDTSPPVLTVPVEIVLDATSPAGAVGTYAVSATDDRDPAPRVECRPISGSVFPIGTTAVACTARDTARNIATASFDVHVKGAEEQLANLRAAIQGVGPGTSLADKSAEIQAALATGDVSQACRTLRAFELEVVAQRGRTISSSIAGELLATTARTRRVLAC